MKQVAEVDAQKLRGGFYTPAPLVDACLERVSSLLNGVKCVRVLEPSAGDGAFVRGLARLRTRSRLRRAHMTCVELTGGEAQACRGALEQCDVRGDVVADSFFHWLSQAGGRFNVVVGNPPFIRYQFVPGADRALAECLLRARGHELQGVSNYWIPFALLGMDTLEVGGVFSLVLPSELLSTMSGGQVRRELIRKLDCLRVDLYPRDTFPDILQDVLVVSGIRAPKLATVRPVTFGEHSSQGAREWQHAIEASADSWTRFLLSDEESEAFAAARHLNAFKRMRDVAALSVAIVTGANDHFTVDDATLHEYGLEEWARPLLARTGHSPGLVFTQADHRAVLRAGKRCWLLDFSAEKREPMLCEPAGSYLRAGLAKGLHTRYKCRIREPWYRVPHIQRGMLMMAKRSHQHHRLILNEAGVFTTDTIYRGEMKQGYRGREVDLVAGFHNSVTMLSAEIEGRTYGGGVLELVPSEIGRLTVPLVDTRKSIWTFDGISRRTGGQRDPDDKVIDATDEMIARGVPGLAAPLPVIVTARRRLRERRFYG